jgi:hypothetical protein
MEKPAETITPDKAKHSINWGALILWPVVILLLYVLSFGPVVRTWDNTPFDSPNPSMFKFYSPVEWTYENTPLHRPLGMYLHLWDPAMYDKNGNERMVDLSK